ncbi:VWA domain-containing protein [Luteolibacter sp. SL250]|uniref:vWA domain-containing protein n=1 Tax=Luteolibacter sp. SL250 TaxID=2995170 RepID=UPI002271066B|nr:vWA domain-containing protein [Luteolibacter sp. SL250]WAC20113.1 VWA domain-containing protein [Luteolibacter sp. SL250]
MKTTYTYILGALAALALPSFAAEDPKPTDKKPTDPKPESNKVQIAILLDTSSSMDGLIDQAKSQLWKVVNSFTEAKRDGQTPFVEVALYEYGNSGLSVANQYIRLVEPMGRDLDELSRELFSLKTNGGEEYCGAVIQRALSDLNWDLSKNTYKAIFIAGNEPFTQGSVDARQACKDALAKGVVVNTIHCGGREEGMQGSWHDGAAIAEGKFLVIDQDRKIASIPAPQDKEISDLGVELNKTYIGYGSKRQEAKMKQAAADTDAASETAAAAPVERAISKASKNYDNRGWDLVDAVREKTVDLAKVPAEELPENMRGMKPEERNAFVEEATKQRAAIQKKITELGAQRDEFIAKERAKQATAGEKTLDEAMVETTREQAARVGYVFGN